MPGAPTPSEAQFSPDGKWIAYDWGSYVEGFDLRIVGLDGSEPRVLYQHPEIHRLKPFGWSPDGHRVLVRIDRKDGTHQIAFVSVAEGSVQVIKSLHWGYPDLALSPDGRFVAYDFPPNEDRNEGDIFILACDGSREIAVVSHPSDDDVLAWTLDGKTLLFRSDRRGTEDVWRISLEGGKPKGDPQLVKQNLGNITPWRLTSEGHFYYTIKSVDMMRAG